MTKDSFKKIIQKAIWSNFWKNYQLPIEEMGSIVKNFNEYSPKVLTNVCLPPFVGDPNFHDYSILISLIRQLKPAIILELGTAHGNTVANICAESEAQVITVNALPEQIDGSIITYTLTKDEIGKVYRDNGYENRVTQIYENTKNLNILEYIPPKCVDLAFIDACHDAEFVVNDFLKILPALSEKAIVLFHDTNPSVKGHLLDSYLGCMYLRLKKFDVRQIPESSLAYWSAIRPKTNSRLKSKGMHIFLSRFVTLFHGGDEKFIRALRWYASVFMREKQNKKDI